MGKKNVNLNWNRTRVLRPTIRLSAWLIKVQHGRQSRFIIGCRWRWWWMLGQWSKFSCWLWRRAKVGELSREELDLMVIEYIDLSGGVGQGYLYVVELVGARGQSTITRSRREGPVMVRVMRMAQERWPANLSIHFREAQVTHQCLKPEKQYRRSSIFPRRIELLH